MAEDFSPVTVSPKQISYPLLMDIFLSDVSFSLTLERGRWAVGAAFAAACVQGLQSCGCEAASAWRSA
jgi:hypothetical protein